jgi:hypothetical protein
MHTVQHIPSTEPFQLCVYRRGQRPDSAATVSVLHSSRRHHTAVPNIRRPTNPCNMPVAARRGPPPNSGFEDLSSHQSQAELR